MTKRTRAAAAAIELKRITDDNDPLRRFQAMALALEQYVVFLEEDEPVAAEEGLTPHELTELAWCLRTITEKLDVMYRRVKR